MELPNQSQPNPDHNVMGHPEYVQGDPTVGCNGSLITSNLTNLDSHLLPHSVNVALELPTFPLRSTGFIVYWDEGERPCAVNILKFIVFTSVEDTKSMDHVWPSSPNDH